VTPARRAPQGLMRGCCALVAVAVVVLGFVVFLTVRVVAAPDLGAAPRGPGHGESQTAIAVSLGAQVVAQLLVQPHATVTLSEHDLTVLVGEHVAKALTDATVRTRGGQVVVSGQHPVGPFTVTPVAHLALTLDTTKSPPSLGSQIVELDLGQLGLPGFIRDRILGSLASSIDLDQVFNGSPALKALRANLECVAVVDDGLRIGVHSPLAAADTSICGS
jgi:hypothetical protein